MKRLRVGVIYGGRSSEHEVSLASAASVFRHLDPARYDPLPIKVDRRGRWSIPDEAPTALSAADVIRQRSMPEGEAVDARPEAHLVAHPTRDTIVTIQREVSHGNLPDGPGTATVSGLALDVVFPIIHGPYGEDGTLQGLLELANVAYVGAGVLASAAAMDKAVAKVLFAARGLPQVAHEVVSGHAWDTDADAVVSRLAAALGYPVFIKPANLGSSVGVSKAATEPDLRRGLALAREFDDKLLVEAAVPNARELECAVLGNEAPEVSVPGEVVPSGDFYDYDAKYVDEASRLIIPAALEPQQTDTLRTMTVDAYRAVGGAGMARVDFLMSRDDERLYLNEVNTIPGFTTISMYAKLWEASGLRYPVLLDRLIDLALARHARKQRLRTTAPTS